MLEVYKNIVKTNRLPFLNLPKDVALQAINLRTHEKVFPIITRISYERNHILILFLINAK